MNNILKKIRQRFNGYGVIVGVVIVMIVGTLLNGESFLTINNVSNVGRQATIRGLLACGMALVIISGSIDLSVSTLFAFSGFLSLYFSNYSAVLAFVIPMAVAAGGGVLKSPIDIGSRCWVHQCHLDCKGGLSSVDCDYCLPARHTGNPSDDDAGGYLQGSPYKSRVCHIWKNNIFPIH